MPSRNAPSDADLRQFFAPEPARKRPITVLEPVSFGEFLVGRGIITRAELLAALQLQDRNPGVRVGECLAALGSLSYQQVEDHMRLWQNLDVVELP